MDPQVLELMTTLLRDQYANAGSITHAPGRLVAELVEQSLQRIGNGIGANGEDIVITSGATESNNLCVFGFCLHSRQTRRKVISVVTEHKAMLDPLERLGQMGFEVVLLPVHGNPTGTAGLLDLEQLSSALDSNTALVSVMLANNEIGTLQPIREIARLCRTHGAMLHTDATQAVGQIPVDVNQLDVDLLSFSAHKFYGPKGVGGLYVRSSPRRIRLQPQILGGGQQDNRRSGTLNSIGIIAMAAALDRCAEFYTKPADYSAYNHRVASTSQRLDTGKQPKNPPVEKSDSCDMVSNISGHGAFGIGVLRNRLFEILTSELDFVTLNGPSLEGQHTRLPGNLNCCFYPIEGQSLMLATPDLAASSGSACTSANPAPSHVLQAIGLSEEHTRSSLRFGVGRFNTLAEIDQAAQWLIAAAIKLRKLL